MFDCGACHGLFVDASTLERATEEARRRDPGSFRASAPPGLQPITYVKCPVCAEVMNRTNFGRRSGVIVDVCRAHGTWFDAGELDTVLAFVAKGGLEETAKRDREEAQRRAREERAAKDAEVLRNALTVQSTYEARRWRAQVTTGQALLDALDALVRLSD
jgi:Zn-finger nucleic acid-binding protein